jgi:hypothetical protein
VLGAKVDSKLSSSENRLEQLAQDLFSFLLIITLAAFAYFVTTMPVIIAPRKFPFGILSALPQQYWIVVSMSVLLLGTSLLSRRTSFVLIASILLTVLVPGLGDLIYRYPRDVFAVVAAQRISQSGYFSPAEDVFLNFPGPEVFFSSLVLVTGTSSLNVVRGFGLVYNPIILLLGLVLFRRFGISRRAAILAALVLVMSFYMQGVLIYTSLLGFVFYVVIAGLILIPLTTRPANTFLIIIFFTAMVVSHAFSPFLALIGIGVLLLGWRFADSSLRRVGLSSVRGDVPAVSRLILVPLMFILTTYWAYFAFIPFSWGLMKLNSVDFMSLISGASAPLLSPGTAYQRSYVQITQLYAPVLFLAYAVYFFLVRDRLRTQITLLILGLGGAIIFALAGYLQEFLARIFAFATFPLSYGVGMLFGSNRRILRAIGLVTLMMVIPLHLPAHYGQDSFQVVPESTIQGVKFTALHTYSNASYSSPFRSLSWSYYFDVYRLTNPPHAGPGLYYVLDYASQSWVLYANGDSALGELTNRVNSDQYNRVYSNSMFDLYSQT